MDISVAFASLMSVKEESEVTIIKKACQATVDLFNKFLKEQIMEAIDAEKVGAALAC